MQFRKTGTSIRIRFGVYTKVLKNYQDEIRNYMKAYAKSVVKSISYNFWHYIILFIGIFDKNLTCI